MERKTRRDLLTAALTFGAASLPTLRSAHADAQYKYDVLGRLIEASFYDGTTVSFSYDAAGNRAQIDSTGGPQPPPPFTATIAVIGPSSANLRTLANLAGYSDEQDADILFTVGAGVSMMGAAGVSAAEPGIDTGVWPAGARSVSLRLSVAGKVYGGGGTGGRGADLATPGEAGKFGGDAVFCRAPISITVEASGELKAGGGGGGGGGSSAATSPLGRSGGGGGGGGGFPNGGAGAGSVPGGSPGFAGSTAGGGAGGTGGRNAGTGGSGASAGQSGANGQPSTTNAPGPGGPPGYAIRKNGHSVTVVNHGIIVGEEG